METALETFPAYGLLNEIIRFTKSITIVSHGRYGVSNHWQLYSPGVPPNHYFNGNYTEIHSCKGNKPSDGLSVDFKEFTHIC